MDVTSRFDVAGFGVIVTGGASGLGLAYGEVLAAHGARVTLIDLDADTVAAQASRLQGEGLDVRSAVADVTDHAALDRRSTRRRTPTAGSTSRSPTPASTRVSVSSAPGPAARAPASRRARSSATPTSAGTA